MTIVQQLQDLQSNLDQVLHKDLKLLQQSLGRLQGKARQGSLTEPEFRQFAERFMSSHRAYLERSAQIPVKLELVAELPISQEADRIRQAIIEHQVVVLAGETGSGKTTQLPKICLQAGRGRAGQIGHTQPRRLAARSVAQRLADELGCPLGEQVGYSVRFDDRAQASSLIKVMTDGILLAEIQSDPMLWQYDTLIIDEAHERSLNIDFLLGYLKRLLQKRPELKLIITSATIDTQRFGQHFNAPVIEVPGRSYPVDLHYLPANDCREGLDLATAVMEGIDHLLTLERQGQTPSKGGDILVFLPGEGDIRDCHHLLKRQALPHCEVLPLYARLSPAEQQRIFSSHSGRRIVLSTNVAETSLTVPGIVYVIDSGLARVSRYSPKAKIQRLPIEAISQASANQRAGRCGRVSHGLCLRLYSEQDFNQRPAFTEPEILRTNLAAVILQMLQLRLGSVSEFPFVEPPDARMIKDGYWLLFELGAVDHNNALTPLGRQLARLPIDPRLGRMLIEAQQQHCLAEVITLVSALSIQDVRERPHDARAKADAAHAQDKDKDSDFSSLLKLWQRIDEQRQALGSSALKRWCQSQYINYLRYREWRDLHRQVHLACKSLGFISNEQAADYEPLHRALASGLLSQVAMWKEKRLYSAARNRQCIIFPGSQLAKQTPKWIMAAELTETSELFARQVARIEPHWLEPMAQHLVKKQHAEPHWEKKRGQVVALETQKLYGLPIVAGRKINFAQVDPALAREIFIRQALVEGEYLRPPKPLLANWQTMADIQDLENRKRKRDLLIDDDTLFRFYDERLPAEITNGKGFEKWLKHNAQTIALSHDQLLAQEADVRSQDYPDQMQFAGLELPINYQFAPGADDDGLTLTVPLGALRQLPANQLDWLVPGMLRDKCIVLIKALPKALRKTLVPVPDVVDQLLLILARGELPLTQALSQAIYRLKQVRVSEQDWDTSKLESHHRLRIKVIDGQGKTVRTGRDLHELKQSLEHMPQEVVISKTNPLEQSGLNDWQGPDLPESYQYQQAGFGIKAYPALVDEGMSLGIKLFDQLDYALQQHQQGIVRLARLRFQSQEKYLRQNLPKFKQSALFFAPFGKAADLEEDIVKASFRRCFAAAPEHLPRTADDFNSLATSRIGDLAELGFNLAEHCFLILQRHHQVAKQLKGKVSFATAFVYSDIKAQLQELVYPGFISATPETWLNQLPRYLQACDLRLNRASGLSSREQYWVEQLRQLWLQYQQRMLQHRQEQRFDPELEHFRWLLEEYRVSLFAQQLGTLEPVSEKRLQKQWQKVS